MSEWHSYILTLSLLYQAFWSQLFFPLVSSSVDCACVAYSVGVLVARDVWLKMS